MVFSQFMLLSLLLSLREHRPSQEQCEQERPKDCGCTEYCNCLATAEADAAASAHPLTGRTDVRDLVHELQGFVRKSMSERKRVRGATELQEHISTYYASDYVMVDPTGTQHGVPSWQSEWHSGAETHDAAGELLTAESVKVFADGKAGVAKYTSSTKGSPSEDVRTISAVFEKKPDGWKCVYEHHALEHPKPDQDSQPRSAPVPAAGTGEEPTSEDLINPMEQRAGGLGQSLLGE